MEIALETHRHYTDQHSHYRGPRRRKEKGVENLLEEIMIGNFPTLGKKTDIQIQKAQKVPKKMNAKRSTPRHIVKCQK